MTKPDCVVALITGTSSNLGINIAYRLLKDVPNDKRLTIIVTSRTLPKAKETIEDIQKFNDTKLKEPRSSSSLDFDYLLIDFTNMVSILNSINEFSKQYVKLDYLFINAAQGVYDGIDWIQATKECCMNPVKASTFPTYKLQKIGVKSKDGLGLVFQANVFGPFYFIQKLKKFMVKNSRIIWISSIMSKPSFLSFDDLQLLKSDISYEGSKRLVDLIHLATYKDLLENNGIVQYVTHPARFMGSKWHNISGWNAANAPIFVALNADPKKEDQAIKYCSATDRYGKEYLEVMEIDPTGKEDILAYFKNLEIEWDDKLKDQITISRQI